MFWIVAWALVSVGQRGRESPPRNRGEKRALLGAAGALEKRADAIHEWPIAEGTIAWVITTSVIAVAIARLILSPLGR